MAKTLGTLINEAPTLSAVIYSGLQKLLDKNKELSAMTDPLPWWDHCRRFTVDHGRDDRRETGQESDETSGSQMLLRGRGQKSSGTTCNAPPKL